MAGIVMAAMDAVAEDRDISEPRLRHHQQFVHGARKAVDRHFGRVGCRIEEEDLSPHFVDRDHPARVLCRGHSVILRPIVFVSRPIVSAHGATAPAGPWSPRPVAGLPARRKATMMRAGFAPRDRHTCYLTIRASSPMRRAFGPCIISRCFGPPARCSADSTNTAAASSRSRHSASSQLRDPTAPTSRRAAIPPASCACSTISRCCCPTGSATTGPPTPTHTLLSRAAPAPRGAPAPPSVRALPPCPSPRPPAGATTTGPTPAPPLGVGGGSRLLP